LSAPALRFTGVAKAFGARDVLLGVDLEVPPGRILVLLGASGTGKSTLLRIAAGLEEADAGRVEVGGVVVADGASSMPAHRRGVGMVFQSLELWPHMTVAENVAFGLEGRPRGAAALSNARVLEVAGLVGLSPAFLPRNPATLSGGERQRVAIARALAPDPAVLLYDEPLANLDPARRADLRRLVRRLRDERGATVLYVTHDAREAIEMGDVVAVLDGGRIVDEGVPADVYRAPRRLASARALGPASLVPAALDASRGGAPTLVTPLGSFLVPPGTDPATRAAVLRPEQVVLDGAGFEAVVTDAHPLADGFAFEARTAAGGVVLEGRSPTRLERGGAVRLAVRGAPAPVSPGADGVAS
jgi:iron(III) transport system ATP-binding protein